MMDKNLDIYMMIRSKILDNQPLLPEERKLWESWKEQLKESMPPELDINDVVATLKFLKKTSCFKEFYEKLKQDADIQVGAQDMPKNALLDKVFSGQFLKPITGQDEQVLKSRSALVATLISWLVIATVFLLLQPQYFPGTASRQVQVFTKDRNSVKVQLADGTTVILNANSCLSYPAKFGKERSIILSGEAYFEVAAVAGSTFTVQSGQQQLQVNSGIFNVYAYPGELTIKTIIVKGRGRINIGATASSIEESQLAIVTGNKITVTNYPSAYERIAWKDNRFFFTYQLFPDFKNYLERWYGVTIICKDYDVNYRYIMDMSKDLPVTKILNRLEKSKQFTFYPRNKEFRKGDTIWVRDYDYHLFGRTALY